MPTLHLAGYHDAFRIEVNKLSDLPCFSKGNIYLIEVSMEYSKLFNKVNEELLNCSNKELAYIKSELEAELHQGLNHTVSANIADLIDLKPAALIPCDTDLPMEPTVYGSMRDKSILKVINGMVNGDYDNLAGIIKPVHELIKASNKDFVFFGGNKHANYMSNELDCAHKVLYDLRPEQPRFMLHKGKLIKT